MNKKISLLLSVFIPGLAVATTSDSSVDAYLLALKTVSPDVARYTVQYKEAIESKCNIQLTVNQINSPGFNNVVNALLFSDRVQTMNIDRNNTLRDTMTIVGQNYNCNDLNAPFMALLNDKSYQAKHSHLVKVLQNMDAVNKGEL